MNQYLHRCLLGLMLIAGKSLAGEQWILTNSAGGPSLRSTRAVEWVYHPLDGPKIKFGGSGRSNAYSLKNSHWYWGGERAVLAIDDRRLINPRPENTGEISISNLHPHRAGLRFRGRSR